MGCIVSISATFAMASVLNGFELWTLNFLFSACLDFDVIIRCSLNLFLLLYLITDFSIIKVEVLYHTFNQNNVYANLLYQTFSGEVDAFLNSLKASNKSISGFVRNTRNKLIAKYLVTYRKRQDRTVIIFKPTGIIIKTSVSQHTIDEHNLSETELIERISALLNT